MNLRLIDLKLGRWLPYVLVLLIPNGFSLIWSVLCSRTWISLRAARPTRCPMLMDLWSKHCHESKTDWSETWQMASLCAGLAHAKRLQLNLKCTCSRTWISLRAAHPTRGPMLMDLWSKHCHESKTDWSETWQIASLCAGLAHAKRLQLNLKCTCSRTWISLRAVRPTRVSDANGSLKQALSWI